MTDGQFIEGLYKDGDAVSADDQHIAVFAKDGSGNYTYLNMGDNGGLKVDIVDASGITITVDIDQYVDGYTITSGEKGIVAMGSDGTNLFFLATDSSGVLAIQDNGSSITVDASNLDIRDLTHVSDSVKVGDGTDFLAINGDGSINVVSSGMSVQDFTYGTQAVAKSASATVVSYTPGSTKNVTSVEVGALGYARWEIKYGTTSSETTKIMKWTTPSNPSLVVDLSKVELLSTETILVVGYNENNATGNMNMYASIRHDE